MLFYLFELFYFLSFKIQYHILSVITRFPSIKNITKIKNKKLPVGEG